MAVDRYENSIVIAFGQQFGTSNGHVRIRSAIKSGVLSYEEIILRGRERLDTVAGKYYGDGKYWWIIAAASDIGWGLQIPPGTVLKIPDLASALKLI